MKAEIFMNVLFTRQGKEAPPTFGLLTSEPKKRLLNGYWQEQHSCCKYKQNKQYFNHTLRAPHSWKYICFYAQYSYIVKVYYPHVGAFI